MIVQIPNPQSPQFNSSVREWINVRDGVVGFDRFVTIKDLYDPVFINDLSKHQYPITRVNTDYGYTGDVAPPRPPTNLQVSGEVFRNTLTWDDPNSDNFWFIEVHRAKVASGAAAPTVADAVKIATVPKNVEIFIDTQLSSTLYDHYYWIKAVGYNSIASVWDDGYVAGVTTINATITNIMDILKGVDPDAWSSQGYTENDRVLHGGKRYKCILTHGSGQEPPNTTYWEQSGILITGNVGGVNTVGIDGNLVVDSSIYAAAINTDNAFIGMTIQSAVYDPGVTGWQINKDGSADFTSGTATWSMITGAGKPDDNADVTSAHACNDPWSGHDLDDLANGTYGKVLTTAISAGKIVLTSAGVSGTLPTSLSAAKCTDANADQTSAHSQAVAWLTDAGALALADDLDGVPNGATYGKVAVTSISAGKIILSEATGDLDDIANGAAYGRVALTAISAGKIVLTSSGVTGTLPTSLSAAKCTDANADQTSSHTALNSARSQGNVTTVQRPGGAAYSGSVSDIGVIKITLPQSWTNTMMKFFVDIFEYTTGLSFTLEVAGYSYADSTKWISCTANLTGSIAANNRVRFGHDGTKCCILIGETTSNWAYINVNVRDLQAGHANYSVSQWDDGWSVSVVSNISGITVTQNIADSLIDAQTISSQGALATQGSVDLATGEVTNKNLDNIANGASYGRVALTAISAGKIVLTSAGVSGTLPTSLSAAKCTDANADQTSAHGQNLGWLIGSSGELTISAGGKLKLNCANALEIQAAGNIKVLAGGDIKLIADNSDPGRIYFHGTSYSTEIGSWQATGSTFHIRPMTHNVTGLFLGDYSIPRRFSSIVASAATEILLENYLSASNHSEICLHSDHSRILLMVHRGTYQRNLIFENTADSYARFYPNANKVVDLGRSSYAWDDAYADDWHNVADFYNFDIHDDLAAINGIKGSGFIDDRTGHELIDDDTLPLWLLSKYKRDGEIREQIKDKDDNMTEGKVLSTHKKGDAMYDPDGKPYLSLKSCVSLCWGAIRQLDSKIEALNEKLN